MSDNLSDSKRKRIAILYGGRADEHPISCISAGSVLRALDTSKFEPVPIGITKNGTWITDGVDPREWNLGSGALPAVEETASSRRVVLDPSAGSEGFLACNRQTGKNESLGHIDAVFPVLHGPYGEDGTIQGLLEMMGIPYVGCGVFASAACMDKHYTKVLLSQAGIQVAPGITLDTRSYHRDSHFAADGESLLQAVDRAGLQYPLFVKPSRAGSSFGVTKIDFSQDKSLLANRLSAAVFEAANHDWRVLIEQGIDGREIECAVLAAGREVCLKRPFLARSCWTLRMMIPSMILIVSTWTRRLLMWKFQLICPRSFWKRFVRQQVRLFWLWMARD